MENVPVTKRAILLLPKVREYIRQAKLSNQKEVTEKESCKNLDEMMKDKLLLAKLHFFLSVAELLQPFLVGYQAADPKAVFLYDDLFLVLRQIMEHYIEASEMEKCTTLAACLKLARQPVGLKLPSRTDIGTAAKNALGGVAEQSKLGFRNECQEFLKKIALKIAERSPLKYKLMRGLSALSPLNIQAMDKDEIDMMCDRFDICTDELFKSQRLTASKADICRRQYRAFVSKGKRFGDFTRDSCRVDQAWSTEIGGRAEYNELWSVVKLFLIMSHGNASVEEGFSLNKGMLVENLKERSLVALRVCKDEIISAGGVLKIDLSDKKLLLSYRGAYSAYERELERQRNESAEKAKKASKKRELEGELKELTAKKQAISAESSAKLGAIDERINATRRILGD